MWWTLYSLTSGVEYFFYAFVDVPRFVDVWTDVFTIGQLLLSVDETDFVIHLVGTLLWPAMMIESILP